MNYYGPPPPPFLHGPPLAFPGPPPNPILVPPPDPHSHQPYNQWRGPNGVHFRPDPNGWYTLYPHHGPPGSIPNMHPPPPGPPRPPMRHAVRTAPAPPPSQPHKSANGANGAPEGPPLLKIDEFWRCRLAPLPGTSSPLNLLSASKAIEIKKPLTKEERRKKRKDTPAPNTPSASASADAVNSPDSLSKTGEISVTDATSPSDTDENNDKFNFDKYAEIFVPQYLQDIQKQPQTFTPLPPLPLFPLPSYPASFLPQSLIDALTSAGTAYPSLVSIPPRSNSPSGVAQPPAPTNSTIPNPNGETQHLTTQHPALLSPHSPPSPPSRLPNLAPVPPYPPPLDPLSPTSYHPHFQSLLSAELLALATTKAGIVLWKTRVAVAGKVAGNMGVEAKRGAEAMRGGGLPTGVTKTGADVKAHVEAKMGEGKMGAEASGWDAAEFVVFVPGIRENYPRVEVGDVVYLREVLVEWSVGSGVAFEGRIVGVRKREGVIHITCPPLKKHIQTYIPATPGQKIDLKQGLPVFDENTPIPMVFNISFLANATPCLAMDAAVAALDQGLKAGSELALAEHGLAQEFPQPPENGLILDVHANGVSEHALSEGPAISPIPIPQLDYESLSNHGATSTRSIMHPPITNHNQNQFPTHNHSIQNTQNIQNTPYTHTQNTQNHSNQTHQPIPPPRSLAHKWLFPDPCDLETMPPTPVGMQNMLPSIHPAYYGQLEYHDPSLTRWVDQGLNEEQRMAASSISMYRSPVPSLISGPPGTGKTRTVVETIHQILRVQPHSHILLCAPSNPATDTLAIRLASELRPHEMLRLNDQNRTFAEIPDGIQQYCFVEDDKFAIPPWKTLMRYRVVVTSCLDASILVKAHCTNTALAMLEEHVMDTLRPNRNRTNFGSVNLDEEAHWTHLLIDEAAQGSEPELLIPISVVLPKPQSISTPQLVLCGDPNQLGPLITSDDARAGELDVSLLERLFERPLYAEHASARSRARVASYPEPPGLRRPLVVKTFIPFVNLVKNYRSHPAILMPPSAIFYNDSLEPCANNGVINWSGLPDPRLPLIFIGSEAKEDDVDERATWYNRAEIERVVETIISLMSEAHLCSPPLRAAEIGVMAPWREQVWKLRERLREEKLGAVDVGSVEDYQGRENRVILISCVRSSARFLQEDGMKGLGLVFERKRMNVGITRAKELLVVVGNGNILKRDPYWKGFLGFVLRNRLYVGPTLDIEMDGNYISRLESHLVHAPAPRQTRANHVNGTGMNYKFGSVDEIEEGGKWGGEEEEEERGVRFAGGIARELLRE